MVRVATRLLPKRLFCSKRQKTVQVQEKDQVCSKRQKTVQVQEKVQVWWDKENMPIPEGRSLMEAVRAIKSGLKARGLELDPSIKLVGAWNEVKTIAHEFEKCEVDYVKTTVGEQVADERIKKLMREYREANPYPHIVIHMSSDSDYVEPLEDFNELGYQVWLIARLVRTKREVIEQATVIWDWDSLFYGVDTYGKDGYGGKVKHPIAEIVTGWIYWRIQVRVIRLWTVRKDKNPQSNIEMIFLDENLDRIHCTIHSSLITPFRLLLAEGECFRIEKVKVDLNVAKYPTTPHKYKLSFIDRTKCSKIENDNIPLNKFFFISFTHILAAQQKDRSIVDIIGHVVEKSELREKIQKNTVTCVIDFVLEDLEFNRLHCSLSGELAQMMACHLMKIGYPFSLVIVLQLCRLTRFQGKMGIENAYHGTRLFIDADLEAVKDYKSKMEAIHGGGPTENGK